MITAGCGHEGKDHKIMLILFSVWQTKTE